MIFLESGKVQKLLIDLIKMRAIMNDNSSAGIALGIHLTAYFKEINKGNFIEYQPLIVKVNKSSLPE